MSLIISPQAGFGNHIRTICGAILLSKLTCRQLYHLWCFRQYYECEQQHVIAIKQSMIDFFFTMTSCESYTNQKPDICYSEFLPNEGWYDAQCFGQRTTMCKNIKKYISTDEIIKDTSTCILIETSFILKISGISNEAWTFMLKDVYSECFTISPKYQMIMNNFVHADACIHIRRNDQLISYEGFDINIDNMAKYINSLSEKCIYIISDDTEYISKLREKINCQVLLYPDIALEPLDKIFVDFLIMATKSKKIYGTQFSSYSYEASLFRNVNYEQIKIH